MCSDSSSIDSESAAARISWTGSLQKDFIAVVSEEGYQEITPKALTVRLTELGHKVSRAQVKGHLQKLRTKIKHRDDGRKVGTRSLPSTIFAASTGGASAAQRTRSTQLGSVEETTGEQRKREEPSSFSQPAPLLQQEDSRNSLPIAFTPPPRSPSSSAAPANKLAIDDCQRMVLNLIYANEGTELSHFLPKAEYYESRISQEESPTIDLQNFRSHGSEK
uniref:HTH myb-type domain-containing protein n=1 Tax=Palpitomonas bilix TaxID=652834 RepID=A0A7S3G0X1_9EUKA|mmetsp:Transcript_12911/g.34023  ORF Transcript_12911/g.34023 Transcript_12911/m.34023 type:complete len:220 (+) Transcript_12911:445-1104(+)|eukprot:CAMPEP_0113877030 /NCGR_PEP_ID=MMETSP0780_2-20120614/5842_1 /TAXON_ID=652834 /ORGANISM="Palpitomonas bilix" /LENGTH=219 /DNA_ID=CAMNT_0000863227 /DNA_START=310 /DNA_END=969 /DNA_ORIENTATION=+ /assembly_acc=CAM_ASM_000599